MKELGTMEVYDDLIKSIRIMYKNKGLSFIKNNGIKTNDKGQIIAGRYADFSLIDVQSLIDAGISEMTVIDEPKRKETVRTFGKKVEEKKPEVKEEVKEVIEEIIEDVAVETVEETATDTQIENEIKEEVKPVKKTRKTRKKKEVK